MMARLLVMLVILTAAYGFGLWMGRLAGRRGWTVGEHRMVGLPFVLAGAVMMLFWPDALAREVGNGLLAFGLVSFLVCERDARKHGPEDSGRIFR